MAVILSAKDLEIGYEQKRLVDPLNFSINEGDLICLMGANGCGKSTLLKTLAGLIPSISGDISLIDRNLYNLDEKELSKILSLVLTDKPSLDQLKVEDIIGLGRYPHLGFWGLMTDEDRLIVDESIKLLGVENLRKCFFQELSDGQKQKVFIARALAQDTPFILLDEPTTFLDIGHRMEILRLLQEISKLKGKTILFTSHDWELVLEMQGQVWLLDENNLHMGAIEEIIMKGVFEKTFKSDGFEFDYKRGSFREKKEFHKKISISGETEREVFWTGRALEKLGIEPVSLSSDPQLVIKDGSWFYENNKFSTLIDLLSFLKSN